jgi:two-component sensor histidine kinase
LTEIFSTRNCPESARRPGNDPQLGRIGHDLINDLFDLSRISQGKFEFHPEEFDLRSMIRDAIGPFEFQAKSKGSRLHRLLDESPSRRVILCDKDRLGQVIKNLVSNAIKFTEQGSSGSMSKPRRTMRTPSGCSFAVARFRPGHPQKQAEGHLQRLHSARSVLLQKFAGMGLGLAISKSLVEGMGGEIKVESTKGKGATFSFYVTCGIVTEEQEPTVRQASPSRPSADDHPPGRGQRGQPALPAPRPGHGRHKVGKPRTAGMPWQSSADPFRSRPHGHPDA